jgi:biopolymer transport protein ExbD
MEAQIGSFRKKAKRKNELYARMDATAFAGVMLVLLFLFMTWPTPFPYGRRVVDLPVTEHARQMPGALREDAMIITLRRDGSTFFRSTHVSLEDLPEMIRGGLQGSAEKRVYVKADARAKYGDIERVLEQIKKAEVEDVSFITEKR